jgi:hypothetical protein
MASALDFLVTISGENGATTPLHYATKAKQKIILLVLVFGGEEKKRHFQTNKTIMLFT